MGAYRKHKKCTCRLPIQSQGMIHSKQLLSLDDSAGVKTRQKVVKRASPCFIRYLSSCAQGILSGNIKLKKSIYKDLAPDKQFLLSLANKRGRLDYKRKLLSKHEGGFWPLLIPIAEAAATAIGSSLFSYGVQKGIDKLVSKKT